MGIFIDETGRIFTLETRRNTTYQMKADEWGHFFIPIMEKKTDHSDMSYPITAMDRDFPEIPMRQAAVTAPTPGICFPQEYSCLVPAITGSARACRGECGWQQGGGASPLRA